MRFLLAISVLFLAAFTESAALGCKCAGTSSVCGVFASADVVFIGKVKSRSPDFDPTDPAIAARLENLYGGKDLESALKNGSPEAFAEIKALFSKVLPGVEGREVAKASNASELEAVLNKISATGQRVTFRIDEAYKGLAKGQQSAEVWTNFTDCGIRFLKGETYVVYADKENNTLSTYACSRTRRLSEAGEDLVYLHFVQNDHLDSGRVYGFVSGDQRVLTGPHMFDGVPLPTPYQDVQLQWGTGKWQAWTNQEGRFVFDGLPAGDYNVQIEKQTQHVHLEPRACKSMWFFVPKK